MHKAFSFRRLIGMISAAVLISGAGFIAIQSPAANAASNLGHNSAVDYAGSLNSGAYLATSVSTSASNSALDLSSTFAIEAWSKPSSNQVANCLSPASSSSLCVFVYKSNSYGLAIYNGFWSYALQTATLSWTWVSTGQKAYANQWQHVALVGTGSALKFFFDGRQTYSISGIQDPADNTNPLEVGTTYFWSPSDAGLYPFQGEIDELKIWNGSDRSSQIENDMHKYGSGTGATFDNTLKHYYDFNEGYSSGTSTQNIFDRVGTNHLVSRALSTTYPLSTDVKSTSQVGKKTIVSFPRSYLTPTGGWLVPANMTKVQALVVGGGGAGGSGGDSVGAGGGGAGGFLEKISSTSPGSTLQIKVGQGGSPNKGSWWLSGFNGQDSTFDQITAVGGGGGGGRASSGANGGSGGGPGGRNTTLTGGTPTSGQGSAGGSGPTVQFGAGSGGGGAGSAGSAGGSATGGAAGAGKTSSITGASVSYAAGGRGGDKSSSTPVADASANTGNGGAGSGGGFTQAAPTSTWGVGAAGGSGFVVLSFAPSDDRALDVANKTNYAKTTSQFFPSSTTQNFSFEAWIKPRTLTAAVYQPIVSTPGDDGFANRFWLGTLGSKILLANGDGQDKTSLNSIRINEWTHIALSFSGATVLLYINGNLDSTWILNSRVSHAAGFSAGYSDNTGTTQFFDGQIDQIKLWNIALAQTQVSRSMHMHSDSDDIGTVSGLTNHFDFNEESGSALDQKGSTPLSLVGNPSRVNIVEIANSNSTTIYKFTRTILSAWGGWVTSSTLDANVLVVAGGGGGGSPHGGGGGAGGVATGAGISLSGTVPIKIGQGGFGQALTGVATCTANKVAYPGQSSLLGSVSVTGGGHGTIGCNGSATQYVAGGSSGGAAYAGTAPSASTLPSSTASITYHGNVGGDGYYTNASDDQFLAGGGGGAGSVGATATVSSAGNGGAGLKSNISGEYVCYAAGGGGGAGSAQTGSAGAGGICDGMSSTAGSGSRGQNRAYDALPNTGSGGGGGGYQDIPNNDLLAASGNGASGVAIVSVRTAYSVAFDANTGTGSIATQYIPLGSSVNLTARGNSITKTGYSFLGWATSSSGSVVYSDGQLVNPSGDTTLYAKWSVNSFAVTYANGGGTGTLPTQANVNYGSTFTVASGSGLNRAGYTFAGWSNGSTTYQAADTYPAVSGAVTLTATWTLDTLNVTYDSRSGSSVSGSTTTTGASIASAPTAPTRAGYSFAGWFTSTSGGSAISFPYAHGETADFTLYAQWTANPTRTVTYALAGGSSTLPTQAAVQDGLTFTVANTPVRFGYTFTGWHDGTTSYNQGTTYIVGSSNITLTATWSADTLNVIWNSNGGSSVTGTTTVTGGTIASAPTNPTKSGYNFDGWYKEVGLTNEAVFPNFVHGMGENFTLYAKWAAATFTITYKAGASGTGADIVQSFVFGNTATIKDETAPLTRAGYSISGWAASDAGSQSLARNASYSSAANIILYPVWSANTNVVTYDEQGGSSVSNGSFATGSTLTLPAASVRNGYTFQGWYTAATGGTRLGSASATISPTATADLAVYAQWTANNYTVTYNGNSPTAGSVPTDNANYNIGSTIAVLGNSGNLTLTGYAFGGWTTTAHGTGTVYNSGEGYVFGPANVTFYAKWLANTYTITYNTNGATSGAPTSATQTYTSGNSGITLTTVGSLVKTGYNFGGWATTPNGAALSGAYTTSADVTLYAVWNVKTVNVTYDRGLATSVATFPSNTTSIYGARYSISSMVSSIGTVGGAGLKFVGWSDGVSIYAAGEPYLVGETDVTFTAQWVHVYEVRYTLNGGTGVLLDSASCTTPNGSGGYVCTDGQPIAANQAPTKPGYNFTGWRDQSNNAIAAGAAFTVNSGSYLLYAQWSPINYNVTYVANGGASAPTETPKNIGDIFTVANGITRSGYAFNGWSDGTRNYGAGASYQVASTNVTLTAQWTANVYTITYDWNGGTGTATANSSYTVGTAGLTLPTVGDHVKDGYSFVGWSETRNGSAVSGSYQATQSRTLYAVWGPGSYTVTYNANGGTAAAASASVSNGGSALLPSATRANYVFEGWYSAQNGGSNQGMAAGVFTPSGSTTLYARWTQLSLYGINPAHLTRVGSLNASGIDSSYSGSNAGSSVQVTVPANTLPTGTTVNMDLVSDFTRAGNLLNDPANFIVSLVVSWVASDGTVPNTYSGKAVSVTIQNSSIKAGSSVYSILGSQVTLLGTAMADGTVTVSLTQDPEIVIAATRPTAPQTVTAVAGQTGTANVSWSAPSSTGGATITGYTVTASTGQTCSTATTSCAVTGLTPGASYTFTVTATNSVGTSLASAASTSLTLSGTPVSSPNLFTPIVKAPIVSNERGQQIIEVSQKKVATTGGSVLKIDTRNMEDISSVTVNGKKAKILGVVDGEIKLQMPTGTKGEAKVVFSGPTGNITMEKVITFVAPKPVDVVASAAMPQGIWTIATPAVQALRKTLLANPDTVLINCVGYQSLAYNTPLDALVARQRAKTACQYLASQAPGVSVKTSVVRTKLTGPASRKLKVTFSAVR